MIIYIAEEVRERAKSHRQIANGYPAGDAIHVIHHDAFEMLSAFADLLEQREREARHHANADKS